MCAHVGAYCIRPSIIPNENGQSFGDSLFIRSSLAGCLWSVCFCAPTWVRAFDRCVVGMFSGRGVLHTLPYRFQRKRVNVFRLRVYSFIPCGMFVGRMQYAPTRVYVFDRWMVGMFLGRGVLYTPLDRPRRGRRIIWGFIIYSFIPCGMFVVRMQYVPTRVRISDR